MQGNNGVDPMTVHVITLMRTCLEKDKMDLEHLSQRLSMPIERTRALLDGKQRICIQELASLVDLISQNWG